MKIHYYLSGVLVLLFCGFQKTNAQQWHSYNPTAWFDVNAIAIPSAGVIAIGGGQEANDATQIMFQTSDYGLTWTENTHDGLAPWNKSIAFSDSVNGYGVGYDGRIIKSTDAGLNWGWAVAPIHRDFNKIIYTGNGTYYVAGGNKTNDSIQTILKSNDYGITWNVIYDTLGPWLKSIFFIDTLKGFAVGDNGVILSTTNGGNRWSTISTPVQRDFNAITFINADTGYIVGGTPSGLSRRTIIRTVNGGVNWNVVIDEPGGILKDISLADTQVGYTVGDSATVIKTTDGGLNWLPIIIDTSLTGNETFNAVKFYGRNFGVVGGKAGLLFVYLDRPVDVFTLGISNTGTTDATLLGLINTNNKNARYSFEYSNSANFALFDTTNGVNIQNDTLLSVSENIQGLTPNTTYYYFLKAVTSSDTSCGDTLMFFTGTISPFVFQTLNADGISTYQASLEGFINKCPEPVSLSFEYGNSPAFGSLVAATPASVSDTLAHNIHAYINGLQENRNYFFRLKGVSATRIYYGNTKMFYTINLPWVNTLNASNIYSNSAQLNGSVFCNGSPALIKFEYGVTDLYGTEVDAVPDSALGSTFVSTSCLLTGLTPLTTYHFRVKATNSIGTSYGEDMTFTFVGTTASTFPASTIGPYSAVLKGAVDANNLLTENKFEYGLSTSYGSEVSANPAFTNGFGNVNISYLLSGLLQNTTYHYRVKATNAAGTVYGNDIAFLTGNVLPDVTTQLATEITHSSARLNAIVNPHQDVTYIKFDYGLTTSYGSEINATPVSSSGSVDLNVYADLNGLADDTFFHFRAKAIKANDTVFGNDILFHTGYPEIPNFDFEIWDSTSIDFPDGWSQAMGSVTKYSPGCDGNFAVKIQNTPESGISVLTMGFVGDGVFDHMPFFGGAPFNERPDSLAGCFNYNIDSGDTAWIILVFKKNGIPISMNIYNIVGNSGGDFVSLKFPIQYEISEIPDSIVLFLSSSNFNQRIHPPNSWLIADNIRFTGISLNIPGNSFEQWHTEKGIDLKDWYYAGKNMVPPEMANSGVIRSTDAASNNYAALVKTSFQASGSLISDSEITNKFPVYARHQSLTGYYKFFPVNNDTMRVNIIVYKNGTNIGIGSFLHNNTISSYTPFIVNITYNSLSEIPDSASISIQSFNNFPMGNSVLNIDNLNFDGFLSGIKEPAITVSSNIDFNVYPNPFNENAIVSFTMNQEDHVKIHLFDLSGKQVALLADCRYNAGNHKLDLSAQGLQKGFYICVINTGNRILSKKLIIY